MTEEKGEKLEQAVDGIRKKFGTDAISFGSVIGNDIGLDIKTPHNRK